MSEATHTNSTDPFRWDDGAPPPGSGPISVIYQGRPYDPTTVYAPRHLATEWFTQTCRTMMPGWVHWEKLLPTPVSSSPMFSDRFACPTLDTKSCCHCFPSTPTNRYCFPSTPTEPPKTEERLHALLERTTAHKVVGVRLAQVAEKVRKTVSTWGDRYVSAEGLDVAGVSRLLAKVINSAICNGHRASQFSLVASPKWAKGLPPKISVVNNDGCSTTAVPVVPVVYHIEGTAPDGAPIPTPIWPDDLALLVCTGRGKNTLTIAFQEEAVVESKWTANGFQARVVEDYTVLDIDPTYSIALHW